MPSKRRDRPMSSCNPPEPKWLAATLCIRRDPSKVCGVCHRTGLYRISPGCVISVMEDSEQLTRHRAAAELPPKAGAAKWIGV